MARRTNTPSPRGNPYTFTPQTGVFKYENGKLVPVLERSWVITLCSDDAGDLWYGHGWNGGGLSRYNPQIGETANFTTAQGLPDHQVSSVARSSGGGIWVGTGGGLARYRGGKIEDFREKLGIPIGAVLTLRRDVEETLWIGSRLGLHRFERVPKPDATGESPGLEGAPTSLRSSAGKSGPRGSDALPRGKRIPHAP